MRTGRSLAVFRGRVYLVPGGVPGPRGVYLVWGGVPGPGGVAPHPGGVPGLGGVLGLGECTWSQGRGCTWSRGVVPGPGGTWSRGRCLPGTPPQNQTRYTSPLGPDQVHHPPRDQTRYTPPLTESQTGVKNITLAQLRCGR